MCEERVRGKDLLYTTFIFALPFSWASSAFGSVYRMISIILMIAFVVKQGGKIPLRPEKSNLRRAFVYYFLIILLSMIWKTNRTYDINMIGGIVLIIGIVYVFASFSYNKFHELLIDYSWIIAGTIALMIFMLGGVSKVGAYGNRVSMMILGTPTDPNEFASLFVITIPLLITHMVTNKKTWVKILSLAIILLQFYAVLLSGSRGALYGIIVACVVTLFAARIISFRGLFIFGIGAVFAVWVVVTFFLPNIPTDVLERLSTQALMEDSGGGRMEIWVGALKQWVDGNPMRWLFGYGINGIQSSLSGGTSTMHNQFIQQIVNYGIIGFMLYIRLLWIAFDRIRKTNRKYLGSFVGIMFVSFTLTMTVSYKPLWILLMMGFVGSNGSRNAMEELDG